MEAPAPEQRKPGEQSEERTGEAIARAVAVFVLILVIGPVTAAMTGWNPPDWALIVGGVLAVSIVAAIVRRRREENPYAGELEKMRTEADEASSPEPDPPGSR